MSGDLSGRIALVTGSTTGIGRAIAEALAARGAAVTAHGLDAAINASVAADWHSRGWRCVASEADLSKPDGALELHATTCQTLGAPDILILNASLEILEGLGELSTAAIGQQVAINLTSSLLLLQACVPAMAAGKWGRVVALGSVQEERPNARHLVYASTKSALTTAVLALAHHEAVPDLTFNVVRPGAIETDRNHARLEDQSFRESVTARIPLRRIGIPADCVGLVSLICSAAGAYINGAVIAVDGGLRL